MLPQAGIEAILSRKHKKQQLSLELVTHHDVVIEDPLVERRQKHPRHCQNANQSLRLRQLTWPPPPGPLLRRREYASKFARRIGKPLGSFHACAQR
jgi:hypothetical protein